MAADRIRRAVPLAAALATTALLLLPALSPDVELFYRDTGRLYAPVKKEVARRLHQGQLALWDPWSDAGVSLLGEVTPGVLHPLTLLYLPLPFGLAFKLNHLLNLPLAALGLYLLARRLGASRWAAATGGVAYGGCGFLLSNASGNLPYAVGASGLPFALWAFLGFLERPTAARLLLAGTLLALLACGGDVEAMAFAGLLGAGFSLARAGFVASNLPDRARLLGRTAAWASMGLVLALPIALPALSTLSRTERRAGTPGSHSDVFWLSPHRFPGLLIAGAFDDEPRRPAVQPGGVEETRWAEYFAGGKEEAFSQSICLGVPIVLLALCAARRRMGALLLLGALVLLASSAGPALGVYRWLEAGFPLLRLFRFPEKLVGPASLLVCLAGALGAEESLEGSRRGRERLAALGFGAALLAFSFAWMVARAPAVDWLADAGVTHAPGLAREQAAELGRGFITAAGFAAALGLVALLPRRSKDLGAALGLSLCAAAAVAAAPTAVALSPAGASAAGEPLAAALEARAGTPSAGAWRHYTDLGKSPRPTGSSGDKAWRDVWSARALQPAYNALVGVEGASCGRGWFSATDEEFLDAVESAPLRVLRVLGVRFITYFPSSPRSALRKGFRPLAPFGLWLRELPATPRAFLVSGVEAASPGRMREVLAKGDFDPLSTALIPEDRGALAEGLPSRGEGPAGSASWRGPSPERQEIAVDARRPGLLVVGTHFDPGWRATLDGREVPTARVDHVAIGVRVPAGVHRVTLRFAPVGFFPGLCAAGCAALAAVAWGARRRRTALP